MLVRYAYCLTGCEWPALWRDIHRRSANDLLWRRWHVWHWHNLSESGGFCPTSLPINQVGQPPRLWSYAQNETRQAKGCHEWSESNLDRFCVCNWREFQKKKIVASQVTFARCKFVRCTYSEMWLLHSPWAIREVSLSYKMEDVCLSENRQKISIVLLIRCYRRRKGETSRRR